MRSLLPWIALLLVVALVLWIFRGGATEDAPEPAARPVEEAASPAEKREATSSAEVGLEGRGEKEPAADAEEPAKPVRTRQVEVAVRERGTRKPLAGAQLRVFPHKTPPYEPPTRVVAADAEGKARLTLADGQLWYVEANLEGYEPARVVLMRWNRGTVRATLDLRAAGLVRGRVVREDGGPLEGVVWVVYAGGDALRDFVENHRGPGPVRTGPDGRFEVRGIALGDSFTLKAEAADGAFGVAAAMRLAKDARAREKVRLTLRPRGHVRFRLLTPDGRPYRGGRLYLRPLAAHGDETDLDERGPGDDGRVLYERLPAGSYVITYHHDDLRSRRVTDAPIVVRPGATTDLGDLHLGTGRSMKGRLVIEEGDEGDLQGLRLKLFDATHTFWTHTQEGGVFAFHDVEKGRFHLEIDSATYRLRERCVVEDGAEGLVLGAVGGDAGLHWTVRDADGKPVPGFQTYVVDHGPPGSPVREQISGEKGVLESEELPPGRYDLMVQSSGFALWRREGVELRRGETTDVEVVLDPARAIRRRVVGPEGRPIPMALATLTYRSDVPFGRPHESGVDMEEAMVTADAKGVLELRPERPDLAISIQLPGFAPVRYELDALPDGPIRLAKGVTVAGRLRTAAGEAPGRVRIALDPVGRHVSFGRNAWTDEAGTFRVVDLAAGTWTLRVHSLRGDVILEKDVVVEAPTTDVGSIRLP